MNWVMTLSLKNNSKETGNMHSGANKVHGEIFILESKINKNL